MSSAVGKLRKAQRSLQKPLEKAFSQTAEKPFRRGTTQQRKQAQEMNQKQMQMEQLRRDEAESEIATRKAAAGKGGRRSLIASSPSGLSTNLGGTS